MRDQEEFSETESENLLGNEKRLLGNHYRSLRITNYLIAISTSLNLLALVLGLIYWTLNIKTTQRSYEHGFTSDLRAIQSDIELVQYRFTGGVKLDDEGEFYLDHSTAMQQYVGDPTPAIDQAWGRLLSGINIDLEESEAKDLHGKTFQWPDSNLYFTGLEVFHSLHCLNRIRQALYPEIYDVFSNPGDPSRDHHIDHCIDHLRQSIQCHADLTPMEWIRVGDKIILDTETLHTCRNFDKVHEWAKKRHSEFEKLKSVKNGSLFVVD